jgi:hypothetical protein
VKKGPPRTRTGAQDDRQIPTNTDTICTDPPTSALRTISDSSKPWLVLGDAVDDYSGLQGLFRERATQLGLSRETIDSLANLTPGLAGKLLAPTPVKFLGWTHIGPLCSALAVALLPVENPQALEEIERRIKLGLISRREETRCSHSAVTVPARSRRWMRRIAASGGRRRAEKLSPKQRSSIARKGAKAWAKKISPERRTEIARHAANALWSKRAARRDQSGDGGAQ